MKLQECYKFDPSIKEIIIFIGSSILAIATIYGIYLRNKQINRIDKQIEQTQQQSKKQEKQFNKQIEQTQEQFKEQIESQTKSRLDDKFSKALELLGSDNLLKQKGGVNILKTLAIESPEHREECLYALADLNEWMKHIKDNKFFYTL